MTAEGNDVNDGLREAILNAAELEGLFDHANDTQRLRDSFAARVLALPELAALLAKAAAADRVRELASDLDDYSPRGRGPFEDGYHRATRHSADRIRRALDGPPC